VVTFAGKLSLTCSLLLPALAPVGALSAVTRTQSSLQSLHRKPGATMIAAACGSISALRLAGRSGLHGGFSRPGRYFQKTATGKEVLSHRRGHATGNAEEKADY
jgi:hypothetical protein